MNADMIRRLTSNIGTDMFLAALGKNPMMRFPCLIKAGNSASIFDLSKTAAPALGPITDDASAVRIKRPFRSLNTSATAAAIETEVFF